MYERNAIVIDRYFANIYGYDATNNIKINSNNYFELVDSLEQYQQASEIENKIMAEYERIANQIKETQKLQEVLSNRNIKYNEIRKSLFENLEEDAEILNKRFTKIENDITKNNEEINANTQKFVEEIKEFEEKSEVRSKCGRERRLVENDYQKILNITTDNFNKISKEKLKQIKTFIKTDDKIEAKQRIKERIDKNGSKEKVPFDQNVITTAIDISTDIEEKRAEILMSLYDKTMKLLDEIKNDTVKIDKHKKIVQDSKSKLEFLNVISEYIILFLDNERMNTIGGQEEHQKNMSEACGNLQKDLTEIQNMYSLLIKEMTGKSSKKLYKELYNLEYLFDLQDAQKEFEKNISRLNMTGAVIYPDYWRLEGMQKIYDTFKHLITDVYGKDLTEYEPLDITFDVNEEALEETEIEEEKNETSDTTMEEDIKSNKDEELEEDIVYEEDINIKQEDEEEKEEEFHWDDEDEDDGLNFGTKNNYIIDEEEKKEMEEIEEPIENIGIENHGEKQIGKILQEYDEIKRDREIDEILGFFDEEDEENSADEESEETKIIESEEDKIFDDDEKIFDEDEEEKEQEEIKQEKEHKKKRSFFGRRR